ncbi:hypothetical protein VNO77_02705 [Canavalia gladiata]|uniref:Uncharacterized protein n=1 Tax=Canavalia gladiata TaxID=3824 RepID=A0AAN9R6C1_CANGL
MLGKEKSAPCRIRRRVTGFEGQHIHHYVEPPFDIITTILKQKPYPAFTHLLAASLGLQTLILNDAQNLQLRPSIMVSQSVWMRNRECSEGSKCRIHTPVPVAECMGRLDECRGGSVGWLNWRSSLDIRTGEVI